MPAKSPKIGGTPSSRAAAQRARRVTVQRLRQPGEQIVGHQI
jgi:hypothetical protein